MYPGGKHSNSKTVMSFDPTTICPLQRAGKPCEYCYVQTQRRNGGWLKKGMSKYDPYDDFVLRLRQESIDELNDVGGMRMFSFGDYLPQFKKDVDRFLYHCSLRKLGTKAITKQIKFIKTFHDYPSLKTIHLSVDNLKGNVGRSPITHPMAMKIRQLYKKVKIRAVVLSHEDLEYFGKQDWVDILTLNHGANGFHMFTAKERDEAVENHPGKICCAHKTCAACEIQCGLNKSFCTA